jgi:hypothetical protein
MGLMWATDLETGMNNATIEHMLYPAPVEWNSEGASQTQRGVIK